MSTVVGLTAHGDDADDAGDGGEEASNVTASDPFAGGHIEVEESTVRAVSPSAWLGGVKRRIDDAVARFTYGK